MARAKKLAPSGLVRSQVRAAVNLHGARTGEFQTDRKAIAKEVLNNFPNVNQNALNKMIGEEEQRQRRVDALERYNKNRKVNLRELVGCRGPTSGVRASLVLTFTDTLTGRDVRYQSVVDLGTTGVLRNILNAAIGQVVDKAVEAGYSPPEIRAGDLGQAGLYRLDYVECT